MDEGIIELEFQRWTRLLQNDSSSRESWRTKTTSSLWI